ncbi:MAG: CapA family protein [Synergistaceae bacterium]|nr:CapA family protein [Synergistaceae bacterium]
MAVLIFIAAFSAIMTGVVIVLYVNVNIRLSADGIRLKQPSLRTKAGGSGAYVVERTAALAREADALRQALDDTVSASNAGLRRQRSPRTDSKRSDGPPQVTLSFVGDCTLGQSYNSASSRHFSAFYENEPKEYFFGGVRGVFASDDLTIVNLEGPLTESAAMRSKPEEGPKYWFRGAPEYAEILSAGSVEIANLANNHTRDFGDEGFRDTKAALKRAGVEYFGYDDILTRQIRGIKIGFFGLSASAGAGVIKARVNALKREGAHVIIASFHGGLPIASYAPTPTQRSAAHTAIDNGAAFVVEHHPHVLQGIELYNGGVIAYSLGNFCFGGNINPTDKDTMIFQVVITQTAGKLHGTYRVIPASISSSDDRNDYRPRLLAGDDARSVLDKIARLSGETDVVAAHAKYP